VIPQLDKTVHHKYAATRTEASGHVFPELAGRSVSYTPAIVTAYYLQVKLPEPVFEYRFHPTRKWRFDLAWPDYLVALEVEGGIWTGGRHGRGEGMAADMEKYNAATCLGWRVLRVQPADLCTAGTVKMIKACLA